MKKTLLITGSLAILLLSACTDSAQPTESDSTNQSNTPTSDTAATPDAGSSTTVAHSEADIAAFNGALQLGDESFCDKITDNVYKQECKKNIQEQKTQQEAIKNQDTTLCDKLSTDDKKASCKIQVEVGAKQAETNLNTQKETKYYNEIINSGEFEKCTELTDEFLYGLCKANRITAEAIKSADMNTCNELEKEELISECKRVYDEQKGKTN